MTPLGIGVDESWQALCEGRSGVGPITRFDASQYRTRIAAEVKGFNTEDFLPKKEAARTQPFLAYARLSYKVYLLVGYRIDQFWVTWSEWAKR